MKLTLGFSPCPNDTFIFDALVNGKVDTGGLEFEAVLEDVQTLNEWARSGKLDISKVSYGVLPHILQTYRVINSGGALGKGVGPLLIGKTEIKESDPGYLKNTVNQSLIAIPGENTTAHFLFTHAFPEAVQKKFLRFDQIENWVLAENGPGVIIHENRFTYQTKGLYKWADLGQIWEQQTGLPIPLGGIVVRKGLPAKVISVINKAIQQSLHIAQQQYPVLSDYVISHAQEMETGVMRQHIELYVNDFTYDMQEAGKAAVLYLTSSLGGKNYAEEEVFADTLST